MISIKKLQPAESQSFIDLLAEQARESGVPVDKNKLGKRVFEIQQVMEQAQDKSPELTVLLAVNLSSSAIGYIFIHWLKQFWTDFPEAFISNFYVSPDWRKKGVGTLLLDSCVNEVKKYKGTRLFLENCHSNPIYKNKFYEKREWKERGDISIFDFPLNPTKNKVQPSLSSLY